MRQVAAYPAYFQVSILIYGVLGLVLTLAMLVAVAANGVPKSAFGRFHR